MGKNGTVISMLKVCNDSRHLFGFGVETTQVGFGVETTQVKKIPNDPVYDM